MDCQGTSCIPLSQSELIPAPAPVSWPAQRLLPQQRQELAIRALAGAETISELARQHEVSRKFVYQQVAAAEVALDRAFAPPPRADDVLFYLPVTKAWLRQLVLALVLICHSSTRGVVELLRDLFDYRISQGAVHNIVHGAVPRARGINRRYDLSGIGIGLLDEIYQAGDPVLVGVDAASTFCFLLSPEDHRDADTWGIRLLEAADRGFAPEATVADFAAGLRAGQGQALPGVPCRGDAFHALYVRRAAGPLPGEPGLRRHRGPDQARAQAGRRRTSARPEGSVPGRQAAVGAAGRGRGDRAGRRGRAAGPLAAGRHPPGGRPGARRPPRAARLRGGRVGRPRAGLPPSDQAGEDLAGEPAGATSWPSPRGWTATWRPWPGDGGSA